MARDRYTTLDLNLLKTLVVLSQEQNMRKAALRLHVTQPAVSQALKKLRHHFDDELFIRIPTGLQSTSFTDKLVGELGPILDELAFVLNDHSAFDPSQLEETIRIALAPHITSYLSTRLLDHIRKQAPSARVHVSSWDSRSMENLARGETHIGVSLEIEQTPKEVMMRKLADDRFTVYVREGHPLLISGDSLTLKDLDGCELALLLIQDWNTSGSHMERLMKANGYSCSIGFQSDSPRAVTDAIRETDMVYTASSFMDGRDLQGLQSFSVKLNNRYVYHTVSAYYHQKNRRNPLTLWLAGMIDELLTGQ